MKKLVFILITALMLTGCAVADAEPSAPVEPVEVAEVAEAVELPEITDQAIETLKESCIMIYADDGKTQVQGSGVAIGENRYLTAYHAIADGRTNLKTSDGEKLTIESYNAELDIMSVTSENEVVPVKIGDSDSVKYGDEIIIISSPNGEKNVAARTNVKMVLNGIMAWQVTSAGSSGGGAFNQRGELVGIVTGVNAMERETVIVPVNTILEKL